MWAIIYVSGAALLFSLMPLVIDQSGSEDRPLAVGAGVIVGFVICSSIVRRLHPTSNCSDLSMVSILRRCCSESVGIRFIVVPLALTSIAGMSYVAFSWSTSYLDTAISATLYEIWPMLWFIMMQYIDKVRRGPHKRIVASWPTYLLLLMGFPAIALIVYSSGTAPAPGIDVSLSFTGLLLAFTAPVTGALVASNLLFIDRVMYGQSRDGQGDWKSEEFEDFETTEIEESISIAGMIITHSAILPLTLPLAIAEARDPYVVVSQAFFGGIAAGCLAALAGLLLRRAHLVSNRREMISTQYLSPLLALLWLYWLVGIDVAEIDLLIFGTLTIVSINMLLNADPENQEQHAERSQREAKTMASTQVSNASSQVESAGRIQPRHGLRALVVSLLYFGMFVYFRKEIFGSYDFGWEGADYWAILALASTVFALLYAFRLTRVESLISNEDYRTIDLAHRIESLPKVVFDSDPESTSKRSLLRSVRALNCANKLSEYKSAYLEVHRFFQVLVNRISDDSSRLDRNMQREISEIRTELDALANGRQNARELAEQIALWLIGGLVVALSLFVPHRSSEIALMLTDTFAILLGSVVVFLLAHLADVGRSRADELMIEKNPDRDDQLDGLYVRFRDDADVTWRRIFASVIIVGIVATIVCLLVLDRLSL